MRAQALPLELLVRRDVERTVEFMYSLKKRLNQILADHTGQAIERVEVDADRDNYMSAAEALEYGLIDKVLENKGEVDGDGDKKKKKD